MPSAHAPAVQPSPDVSAAPQDQGPRQPHGAGQPLTIRTADSLPTDDLLSERLTPTLSLMLLKELVAFEATGTQEGVADMLGITQPAVTRGLRQLERLLHARLFNRKPNRTTLTDLGRLAARYARQILADENTLVAALRNRQRAGSFLSVASTMPGPLMLLARLLSTRYSVTAPAAAPGTPPAAPLTHSPAAAPAHPLPHIKLGNDLVPEDDVQRTLLRSEHTLVFTSQEILTDRIESVFLGSERVSVCINEFSPLSNSPSLTFADLRGSTFLVARAIGPWRRIIETAIPDSHFLYQQDLSAMDMLMRASTFPVFVSNLSRGGHSDPDRLAIPLEDPANRLDVYATYLTVNRRAVTPLVRMMQHGWPEGMVRGRNN